MIALDPLSADSSGSWTLLVVYFVLAISVSFFCSVWEAVLLSVTRPYIADLKKKRPKAGEKLEALKNRIDKPLTSILTLNTIAHTMGAMGVAGQISLLTGGNFWETVSSVVMTLAILIASEIIPKNLGARHWKAWAPWVASCLHWLSTAMTPFVNLIGIFNRGGHHSDAFSRDELTIMAEMGRREGQLHEDESRILHNLLTLRDITLNDVKTPRVVVFSLKSDTTVQEYVDQHVGTTFSRIPLFGKNRDDIIGFVLRSDVLMAAAQERRTVKLRELKRPLTQLSEHTRVLPAFETLTKSQHHLAIVYDEYGGLTGLVTMEDIVETLLGLEIVDELDAKEDMQAFARSLWQERAARMATTEPIEGKST